MMLVCSWRVFISLLAYFWSQALTECRAIGGRNGPHDWRWLRAKMDGKHILSCNTKELLEGEAKLVGGEELSIL